MGQSPIPKHKSKKTGDKNFENISNKFIWLKYKENSCSYDTFTLIYKKIIPQNIQQVINLYHDLLRTISFSSKEDFNKNILKFIDKLDVPLSFKNTGYKIVYEISQLFSYNLSINHKINKINI